MIKESELCYSPQLIKTTKTNRGILDKNFRFVTVTEHAAKLCGYKDWEKMLGTTVFDFPCAVVENAPQFYNQDKQVLTTKKAIRVLNISEYADGKLQFYIANKTPLFSVNDEVIGLETLHTDLNQQSKVSQFCLALYKNSLYLHNKGLFCGISYQITELYDELNLSKRQSEILFLLGYGKTSKEIANILHLSSRTIEHHINEIRSILNINTKPQLVEFTIMSGLIYKVPASLIYA